jgi:hypothetical protein
MWGLGGGTVAEAFRLELRPRRVAPADAASFREGWGNPVMDQPSRRLTTPYAWPERRWRGEGLAYAAKRLRRSCVSAPATKAAGVQLRAWAASSTGLQSHTPIPLDSLSCFVTDVSIASMAERRAARSRRNAKREAR